MNLLRLCIGIVLVSAALLAGCTNSIWHKVDLARRQGDLLSAKTVITKHLQDHPQDAEAYFLLGQVQAGLQEWQPMIEAFATCEQLDPAWNNDIDAEKNKYWTQSINAGMALMRQHHYAHALEYFTAATTILPQRGAGFRMSGEALLAIGDTSRALRELEQGLTLNVSDERARTVAMRILFGKGNYERAIEMANLLIQTDAKNPEAWRIKACSYDALDDYPAAENAYTRLLELSNRHADLETFAALQYRYGRYENSAVLLRRAIDLGGDRKANLQAIAQVRLMQKNYQEIARTASELLSLDPHNAKARQLLKLAYVAMGQENLAAEMEQRFQELTNPN